MKKLILTIIITFCSLPAFSFDNYMIVSENPVKSVDVENSEILDAEPVFTIDNEKKFIIITPKTAGKTRITVNLYDSRKVFEVNVTKNSTTISPQNGFKFYIIDSPPSEIDIPLPPAGGDNG